MNQDPSPSRIAAECLEIQSGWSDEERLHADWRPMVTEGLWLFVRTATDGL